MFLISLDTPQIISTIGLFGSIHDPWSTLETSVVGTKKFEKPKKIENAWVFFFQEILRGRGINAYHKSIFCLSFLNKVLTIIEVAWLNSRAFSISYLLFGFARVLLGFLSGFAQGLLRFCLGFARVLLRICSVLLRFVKTRRYTYFF